MENLVFRLYEEHWKVFNGKPFTKSFIKRWEDSADYFQAMLNGDVEKVTVDNVILSNLDKILKSMEKPKNQEWKKDREKVDGRNKLISLQRAYDDTLSLYIMFENELKQYRTIPETNPFQQP